MHVTVTKSGGREYVQVREFDPVKKRTVVVKSLGRLDELIDKSGNPKILESLKAEYASKSEAIKKEKWDKAFEEAKEFVAGVKEPTPTDEVRAQDIVSDLKLNFGWLALRAVFDRTLGLTGRMRVIEQRTRKGLKKISQCFPFLVYSKILDPRGIQPTWQLGDHLLGNPRGDATAQDLFNSLDLIHEHKGALLQHLNTRVDKLHGKRRASLVFYDTTNTYFETPLTDKEKDYVRSDYLEIIEEKIGGLVDKGTLPSRFLDPCASWSFEGLTVDQMKALSEILDEAAECRDGYLRMRGKSKEGRYDLPLVSIAMVIDRDGIPMDYKLVPGNTSEFKAMPDIIREFEDRYDFENTVVVADRGLNSGANLAMLQDKKFGFLMGQRISGFTATQRKDLLNLKDYLPLDPDHPEGARYRTVKNYDRSGIGGSVKDCTLVLTYCPNRKKRDEKILDLLVDLVKRKTGKPLDPRKSSWASLAKLSAGQNAVIEGINEKNLKRQRELCGYAAVVFKNPPGCDSAKSGMGGAEAAATYHRLNRIEDCFRILKSGIKLRPVHVWTAQHIDAHVFICFLALVLIQMIQYELRKSGINISPRRLTHAIRGGTVLVQSNNSINDVIFSRVFEDKVPVEPKSRPTEEWMEFYIRNPGLIDDLPMVLKALGLKFPPKVATRKEMNQCLGTILPAGLNFMSNRYQALFMLGNGYNKISN